MSHVLVLNPDAQPLSIVPLSTMPWDDAIKAYYTGHVDVIHHYEDWLVHSPSVTMHVPSVVMTREFIKIGRAAKYSKANIYLRDRYTCQYCDEIFPPSKLTLDHVVPRTKGGKSRWDNIATACGPCNFEKAHHTHKMFPKHKPYAPTYYQLVAIKQERILEVPDLIWNWYLNWPDDMIRLVIPDLMRTATKKAALRA